MYSISSCTGGKNQVTEEGCIFAIIFAKVPISLASFSQQNCMIKIVTESCTSMYSYCMTFTTV